MGMSLRAPAQHREPRAWVGDVTGGLTVAALVVPLSLGLAVTAGLPPQQGLVASALPMIVFALLASSRRTMIGPDASVTALLVASVLPLAHERGVDASAFVAATAVAVGIACILAAFAGVGRIATLLDGSALIGYLAGLAVVVAVAQLPRITAHEMTSSSTVGSMFELLRELGSVHWASVMVGMGTCGAVLLARAARPSLPWMLISVAVATAMVHGTGLDASGVRTIGSIPTGLPALDVPRVSLEDSVALAPIALVVAVVTFADTLATATAFAARHGEPMRPGRDLGALGAADIVSGAVGGMPVSASGARTAAAEAAGGTSQLTGVVAAIVILTVLAGGGDLVSLLPIAALGGIVVAAVVPMVDVPALRRLRHDDGWRFAGAVAVFVTVVAAGVMQGVAVAVAVSLLARYLCSSTAEMTT